jgi:hypothetical protein
VKAVGAPGGVGVADRAGKSTRETGPSAALSRAAHTGRKSGRLEEWKAGVCWGICKHNPLSSTIHSHDGTPAIFFAFLALFRGETFDPGFAKVYLVLHFQAGRRIF